MCYGCWEDYGLPKIDTPEVRELATLARGMDEFGGFHLVLADWNLEDNHIEFCMKDEKSTEADRAWGSRFLKLSEEERASVMAIHDNWWKP